MIWFQYSALTVNVRFKRADKDLRREYRGNLAVLNITKHPPKGEIVIVVAGKKK
jgi:hypothetical protein